MLRAARSGSSGLLLRRRLGGRATTSLLAGRCQHHDHLAPFKLGELLDHHAVGQIGTDAIEQHAGALPVWLAPVQVVVTGITDAQADYARNVAKTLRNQGFRVETDLRNEKITYKIREHSLQKLPYILVVGDKEREAGAVAVRARGNVDLGVMSLEAFAKRIGEDIASKA